MAITKELVEKMGGRIWVESTPGVGTKVKVRFDFRRADTADLPCDTGAREDFTVELKGKKVLLVEDNALNREIAVDIRELISTLSQILK